MSLKNSLPIAIVLVVCIILYQFIRQNGQDKVQKRTFSELQDREHVKITFNKNQEVQEGQETISVEVVNTPQSTTQGLSGRTEIGANGMLFIFPVKQIRYFWMKDMNFDIDMIWIAEGKVVEVTSAVPKPLPETPDNRLQTYSSQQEVDMVLEVNANDAQKYTINPGDVVQLVE